MTTQLNRRRFLQRATSAGAATFVLGSVPFAVSATRAPGAKLNLACIGIGRRGGLNLKAMAGENIAAICEVDEERLGVIAAQFPRARKHVDYRKLLEQEKGLDGVVISTPDHSHAPAALMAMNLGLNVYCEKPLTHTVGEARRLAETAARTKVITSSRAEART